MTETGPMAASSRYDDPLPVRAGAHGRPMPGLEFRIVDPDSGQSLPPDQEGELLVRGDSLMSHYYKLSPADCFDAEGFFHTGDLARLDADGPACTSSAASRTSSRPPASTSPPPKSRRRCSSIPTSRSPA